VCCSDVCRGAVFRCVFYVCLSVSFSPSINEMIRSSPACSRKKGLSGISSTSLFPLSRARRRVAYHYMKKTSLLFFRELFDLFTIDTSQNRFPDPKSMVEDLHSIGCKAIWMLDPGIKEEEGYFVYESGSKNDVWIQKADGSPFVGMFR
jgi:hypothetical protein